MTAILTFQQSISDGGFRWEADDKSGPPPRIRQPWNSLGDDTPRLSLFANDVKDPQQSLVVSPTADDSSLFRNFARMEPTPDQILEFAGRYGSLWMLKCEPFCEWEFEIRTMRFLVDLWDAVVEKKKSGLIAEHFRPDENGVIAYLFPETMTAYSPYAHKRVLTTEHGARPGVGWGMIAGGGAKGKPLEVASLFIWRAVNTRLNALGSEVTLDRLGPDQYRLAIRPHDLLGALWVQFALAISDSKEFRQCEVCGRSFELDPGINRTSRFYCQNACRVKAYRMRKAEANRLHNHGKTLRQIATQLESDVPTVKKWITRKPPKGK